MSDKDTITLPREVVQEALEALEHAGRNRGGIYTLQRTMLRTALAAEPTKQEPPKQEALCWFCHGTGYQKNPVYPALVPCPNCKPKEYFK